MNPEALSELKVKNLTFIQHHFPGLYSALNQHFPDEKRLNIDTNKDAQQLINLQTGQILIANAEQEAEEEVHCFLASCHRNNRLITVPTPLGHTFTIPRFAARKLTEITLQSPLQKDNFNFYPFDGHIPMLCIMGFGLGRHIQKVLSDVKVDHLVIFERDLDEIYASLFCCDWKAMFEYMVEDSHKSVTIIVPPKGDEEAAFGVLWNHLVKQPPFFPTATVFYNHRSNNRNEKVLARIRKDLTMYYSLWGNYDDEINQLNNALHNFRAHIPRIGRPLKEHTQTPVLIIGSGPSLDERLDWIKSVKDKALIVSCGSARDVLRRNGIQPDFQVELESDYVAAEAYSRSTDKSHTKGTTLIAAAQVPPKIFDLYESRQAYLKDSTAMASLFADNNVVSGCTPSATNAGLGVFLHFGFENVFLFGMDFGYSDPEKHHSKDSIYYTDENPEDLIDSTWDNLEDGMPVMGVQGKEIKTIPFLYTGMRRAEVEIASTASQRELKVFNCSLGAQLSLTQWIEEKEDFISKLSAFPATKDLAVAALEKTGDAVTEEIIAEKLELMEEAIRRVCARTLSELSHVEDSFESVSECTYRIARFLEEDIYINLKTIYYFFRGTMWFFISVGYAHTYALSGQERSEFIELWKQVFSDFLHEWPEHYRSIVYRKVDVENDPMLVKMITEPVEGA